MDYLPYLTSTVGLITTPMGDGVNVMSAEWTYFVARQPLHIAVCIQDSNYTQELVQEAGEFSVTLCDTSLAALADFAGSFSGTSVDKCAANGFTMAGPHVTRTPHVAGGVLNAECVVRHTTRLPGYLLVIGEAVWAQVDDEAAERPLVKHGRMHALGEPVLARQVVASARRSPDGTGIEVAATAQGAPGRSGVWQVSARDQRSGRSWLLMEPEEIPGDLWAEIPVPDDFPTDGELAVVVERDGCAPGEALLRGALHRTELSSTDGGR